MPAEENAKFGDPLAYPYMTVSWLAMGDGMLSTHARRQAGRYAAYVYPPVPALLLP